MNEAAFYHYLLIGWVALSALIFGYLLFVPAPYGRHQRAGWGPTVNAKTGWVIMESPAVFAFAAFFALGLPHVNHVTFFFFWLWQFHYLYRTFVFPARLPRDAKPVPLAVVASGFFFNIVNAYLNGRYLFHLAAPYPSYWLWDPRCFVGVAVFFLGFAMHSRADATLRRLRLAGQGYQVPQGGWYRYISCPNYFGEIVEWGGWALATWSPGSLAFFLWTIGNLLPRALAHHRWYRHTFPDYPQERKAIIPFLL
jgi:protein-S-isoprenylcysteine O-methyltransferase Ste14